MISATDKTLVLFGAGKIGRSFIAQLFYSAGYHTVFIDTNPGLVEMLNESGAYRICITGEGFEDLLEIGNISALHISQKREIVNALCKADIAAVSVGQRALVSLAEIISHGIMSRYELRPDSPLDLILAENLRDAEGFMLKEFEKHLPKGFPLTSYIGLVETSIGKMVPQKSSGEDPLLVYAEPYNTLIVDAKGFRNKIPEVKGLSPREDMKAWVDRKLFIHNLGHASLAYLAWRYDPMLDYTWQALEEPLLKKVVRETMYESGRVLLDMHPGSFSLQEIGEHIEDLLRRFGNKALGDTIFRVGCDLARKLGPDDRLVPVIRYAFLHHLPYRNILTALVAGMGFSKTDESGGTLPEDSIFFMKYSQDVTLIMKEHCNFDPQKEAALFKEALELNHSFKQKK